MTFVLEKHHPYFLWVVGMRGWASWESVVFFSFYFCYLLLLFLYTLFPPRFFYPQLFGFLSSIYLPDTQDTLAPCYKHSSFSQEKVELSLKKYYVWRKWWEVARYVQKCFHLTAESRLEAARGRAWFEKGDEKLRKKGVESTKRQNRA